MRTMICVMAACGAAMVLATSAGAVPTTGHAPPGGPSPAPPGHVSAPAPAPAPSASAGNGNGSASTGGHTLGCSRADKCVTALPTATFLSAIIGK